MLLNSLALVAAVFTAGNTEIVVSPQASLVTRFAAKEIATFLGQTLKTELAPVESPTPGKAHVYVGASHWATAAGVVTNGLARDAFRLKVTASDAYVVGADDGVANVEKLLGEGIWKQHYERASVFGAYEFLERYAGTRFYFVGELGTVVQPKATVVAAETDETVAPVFTARSYSYRESDWFEGPVRARGSRELWGKQFLNAMRLRMETSHVPCCHGLNKFFYLERFGKTHPEYFQLKNGKRNLDETIKHKGHICNTSGIWEEIYQDTKAYLTGKQASTRNLPTRRPEHNNGWSWNCSGGKYVDIMCQDGLNKCECETCQARYVEGRDWCKELIWSNTVAVANRLTAEGVPGSVTQMAYTGYRAVPETVEIPSNVMVMVSQKGPWAVHQPHILDQNNAEIAAWHRKLGGRPVWLWLYMNKFAALCIDDVPTMTPKCVGEYFAQHKTDIFGAFIESECERFLYNHLNWYVFSRICWNVDVDVAAILDEYYRLMFGPAADEIRAAFELFERKWVDEIGGHTIETPIGPMGNPPADVILFRTVYSPAVIGEIETRFRRAAEKAASAGADSLFACRVDLMWREIAEPLVKRARAFQTTAAMATPTAAAKLLEKSGDRWSQWMEQLEPDQDYVATVDLKLEDVKPLRAIPANGGSTAANGGVQIIVYDAGVGVIMHPYRNVYVGSFDWARIRLPFRSSAKSSSKTKRTGIAVHLSNADGKVWVDNLKIEKVVR